MITHSTLQFETAGSLLIVLVRGQASSQDSVPILKEILAACPAAKYTGVLVDVREQTGTLEAIDRYRNAESYGRYWPKELSVALVENAELCVQDYLFETVTSRYGVSARIFCDVNDALGWLRTKEHRLQDAATA
jgi:hypothetical protein